MSMREIMPIMSALANPTQSQRTMLAAYHEHKGLALHSTCIKLQLFKHKNKTENGNRMTGLYV